MVQVHVPATVWGFESLRWHQVLNLEYCVTKQLMWGQPPSAVQSSEARLSFFSAIAVEPSDQDSSASLNRTAEGGCPHMSFSLRELQFSDVGGFFLITPFSVALISIVIGCFSPSALDEMS